MQVPAGAVGGQKNVWLGSHPTGLSSQQCVCITPIPMRHAFVLHCLHTFPRSRAFTPFCFFVLWKDRVPQLKLVITSATLDGEKFSIYFNSCPVSRSRFVAQDRWCVLLLPGLGMCSGVA